MSAVLDFEKLKVFEMVYKSDLNTDFGDEISPILGVEVAVKDDDIYSGLVKLSIRFGDEKELPYLNVTVAGVFKLNSKIELTEEQVTDYYEINATAILFPYLRSIVTDLTSKGDESPIVLPPINVHAYITNQRNKNKLSKA
ncbi:protein-export chaperone SecB [Lysinibacillus sp. FSL W8-0992]|uniref:protein-export chaperone SecB n=1 Tax=Lysinibacillus sp. FSL W8-0992 TaxID=2954643 RepID=UPI0030F912B2